MFSFDPKMIGLALQSTHLATWEWNPATDELRWTSGQAEIYLRPSNELNSITAWNAIVHPGDRERLFLAAESALKNTSGFREQFRVLGRDGKIRWIFGYANVSAGPDGAERMSGLNLDVTDWVEALTASEAKFTATFEQAAVGIDLVHEPLRSGSAEVLGKHSKEDITLWGVHPGGKSVLDAVERGLGLAENALAASRQTLECFGNMSSATVMFVLERLMQTARPGEKGCAMSFGPGLTAETMLFHAV